MIAHDWLHVVDLTLIPEASASALLELARENVFGGGTMDEKLRKAHIMFIRACRQHSVRTWVASGCAQFSDQKMFLISCCGVVSWM